MNIGQALFRDRLVPVVVIEKSSDAVPTVKALRDGGLHTAEITFRTPCAAEAIAAVAGLFGDMIIGAGTVITPEQCAEAIEAGAKFIVSPGFDKDVAEVCAGREIFYLPGCATPTEIIAAYRAGLRIVKFFPAGVYGGLPAIKAIGAAFPEIRFLPTGGINEENILDYLMCDKVVAVGGSFMMKGDIRGNTAAVVAKIAKFTEEKR